MATIEAKKHCGREGGIDRISELPDPLIHHILSFVPTFDVVRISILSKRWRHMWVSIPMFYFKDVTSTNKAKIKQSMFFKFVTNYMRHRGKLLMQFSPGTSITRFKMEVENHFRGRKDKEKKLDDWLRFAIDQGNMKELDLSITTSGNKFRRDYCLSNQSILNSTSLTFLKLESLKLDIFFPVSLPNLKSLYLKDVKLEDKTFQDLIYGCSIIEDLHLKSACWHGKRLSICKIDLSTIRGTLKILSFDDMRYEDQWFEDLCSVLPLVETLTLRGSGLKHVRIRSQSLKCFILSITESIEATFDTPNLLHFRYDVRWRSIFTIDAPNLLEANMNLRGMFKADMDFIGMTMQFHPMKYYNFILFLSNLKGLKKMTLIVDSEDALLIPDYIRNMCRTPLPNLKHLKVKITTNSNNNMDLNDSEMKETLFWCAPNHETIEIKRIQS